MVTTEQVAERTKFYGYLDELRESGATNMFGAAAWLEEAFDLERKEARALLSAWMGSFDGETPAQERAEADLKKEFVA